MNEIRRIESETDEISRVRSTMDRFSMPDFVVSYTVKLGEFDDEPAMWIGFQTSHRFPETQEQALAIGKQLRDLSLNASEHLRQHHPTRYPYFRFSDAETREKRQA